MAEQLAPILNLARIPKAIAGGRSAAAAAMLGGGAVAGLVLPWVPERITDQIPWWVYVGCAAVAGVVGFVGGFTDVYFAKENAPPLVVAPEGAKVVPDAAVVMPEKKEKTA